MPQSLDLFLQMFKHYMSSMYILTDAESSFFVNHNLASQAQKIDYRRNILDTIYETDSVDANL